MARRRTLILLLAALLLAGCKSIVPPPDELPPVTAPPGETTVEPAHTADASADGRFSLRFNPEATLNPYTANDPDNILLTKLLYESFFVLDENFLPVPQLCETCETLDGVEYEITLRPGVAMSDGTTLDASDAAYSINLAREGGRFAERLRTVESATVTGELTLKIKLTTVNRRFTSLLDVPIVKYGYNGTVPPGSGPYVFADGYEARLTRSSRHRDAASMPVESIYLVACADNDLAELFTLQTIDLFVDDPTDGFVINVRRDHETRYYDTTVFQFLGFNTRSPVLRERDMRRAFAVAVDRQYITDEILGGHAIPANIILSPKYRLYNESWSPDYGDPVIEMSAILGRLGMEDSDNDSYLEYVTDEDPHTPFSIDFIVNSENDFKVRTAEHIAATVRRVGINITLRKLPWEEYIEALNAGDFDIYFGETQLTADFDFSPLLSPGGSLDYGGLGSAEYAELTDAFLASESDATQSSAARALCAAVLADAPLVPILYKQYAVHSGRNVISGMSPSQSNVLRNFESWTIRNL
jgi:peptide/nickel transport system substrate-binding protein